jgi:hypothetical protein
MTKYRKRKAKAPQGSPAPWMEGYKPKGKPNWSRNFGGKGKAPWSDPIPGAMRGGRR